MEDLIDGYTSVMFDGLFSLLWCGQLALVVVQHGHFTVNCHWLVGKIRIYPVYSNSFQTNDHLTLLLLVCTSPKCSWSWVCCTISAWNKAAACVIAVWYFVNYECLIPFVILAYLEKVRFLFKIGENATKSF